MIKKIQPIALPLLFGASSLMCLANAWGQKLRPMEHYEKATLAGGCFWCLEAAFQQLKGVVDVVSGYTGGHVPNPSYEQVCTGTTGHAEAVQITYDPRVISYDELLEVFWTIHDPTTLNRQGADVGTQYRSAIFYHNEEQRQIALRSIREVAQPLWKKKIVTEVVPLDTFYPAEDYHQEYYFLNKEAPYCRIVIAPKLEKLRHKFEHKLKKEDK